MIPLPCTPMQTNTESLPSVSIVITVRNEARHIGDCLTRILASTYPAARLEVLVADGGSVDGTKEVVRRIMADNPIVRLIEDVGGSREHGLNTCIRAARGEIVARIDARTRIPPDYIATCVDTLLSTGADNVGGWVRPVATSKLGTAVGYVMASAFAIDRSRFRSKPTGYVHTVYLGCFKKDVFDRVGLFDEREAVISEDSDLNMRILSSGGRVYRTSDIVSDFCVRDTLYEFWRLYFRYGAASAGFFLKHARHLKVHELMTARFWRQFLTPLLVLLATAVLATPPAFGLKPILVVSALGCGLSAALSTLSVRKRTDLAVLAAASLLFPCMYVSHGVGYLLRICQGSYAKRYWCR